MEIKTYYIRERQKGSLPIAVDYDSHTPKYQRIHRHDGCEIMFIYSGYGWCSINGVHLPLLPGDLFFMKEGDEHEFLLNAHGAYYNVMFRPEIFSGNDWNELRKFSIYSDRFDPCFSAKYIFPLPITGQLSHLLESLRREAETEGTGQALMLKARLCELLITIGRYASIFNCSGQVKADSLIGPVIDYVLHHFNENISLTSLARQVKCSPEYLGKKFRKSVGLGVSDYLAYVRIDRARSMLEKESLTLSEIAYRLGFCDPAHFSKTFQKITGVLPSNFRKHVRSRSPIARTTIRQIGKN